MTRTFMAWPRKTCIRSSASDITVYDIRCSSLMYVHSWVASTTSLQTTHPRMHQDTQTPPYCIRVQYYPGQKKKWDNRAHMAQARDLSSMHAPMFGLRACLNFFGQGSRKQYFFYWNAGNFVKPSSYLFEVFQYYNRLPTNFCDWSSLSQPSSVRKRVAYEMQESLSYEKYICLWKCWGMQSTHNTL